MSELTVRFAFVIICGDRMILRLWSPHPEAMFIYDFVLQEVMRSTLVVWVLLSIVISRVVRSNSNMDELVNVPPLFS